MSEKETLPTSRQTTEQDEKKAPLSVSGRTKRFKEQFDEEDVLLVFRKHPIVMRQGLILAMLGILAGMIPALIKPEYDYFFFGLLGGFLLGVILIFPWWVRWYFSIYIMT